MENQTSQEFQKWVTSQLPRLGDIPFKCPNCSAVLNEVGETCPQCTQPVLRSKSFFSKLGAFEQNFSMAISGVFFGVIIIWGILYIGKFGREAMIVAALVGPGYAWFFFRNAGRYFRRSASAVAGATMTGERYLILGDRYVSQGPSFASQAVIAYSKGISLGASILEHGTAMAFKRLCSKQDGLLLSLPPEVSIAYCDILAGAILLDFIRVDATKLEGKKFIVQYLLREESPACDVAEIMMRNNPHWRGIKRMEVLLSCIDRNPKIRAILKGEPITSEIKEGTIDGSPKRTFFKCPAIKRFALWFHKNCEVIVTPEGLQFIDHEKISYSFDLSSDELRSAKFKEDILSDLIIILKDGTEREIGLEVGDRHEVLNAIKEIIGLNPERIRIMPGL